MKTIKTTKVESSHPKIKHSKTLSSQSHLPSPSIRISDFGLAQSSLQISLQALQDVATKSL